MQVTLTLEPAASESTKSTSENTGGGVWGVCVCVRCETAPHIPQLSNLTVKENEDTARVQRVSALLKAIGPACSNLY